jgi:membrane protein
MNAKLLLSLTKETFSEFSKDNATRLSAALAYYTIFSIAPLLIIVIAIAALWLGSKGATQEISWQIRGLVGDAGGTAIQSMVESANKPRSGVVAVVVGFVTLLVGATGVFGELKSALNIVWKAKPAQSGGILEVVKDRFLSFSMVLGIGFLLLVSLIISAALAALGKVFDGMIPGWEITAHLLNFVISLALVSVLFAMIFKFLPDVHIRWSDVWHGAIFTSLLFSIGKFVLGLYLGKGAVGSSYGVAGSLVVVLLWVYYSSMILLLGAEFTEVYARRVGARKAAPIPTGSALANENAARSKAFLKQGQ